MTKPSLFDLPSDVLNHLFTATTNSSYCTEHKIYNMDLAFALKLACLSKSSYTYMLPLLQNELERKTKIDEAQHAARNATYEPGKGYGPWPRKCICIKQSTGNSASAVQTVIELLAFYMDLRNDGVTKRADRLVCDAAAAFDKNKLFRKINMEELDDSEKKVRTYKKKLADKRAGIPDEPDEPVNPYAREKEEKRLRRNARRRELRAQKKRVQREKEVRVHGS